MKIALISDVHGHHTALRAVLDDIEREGVSEIVFLGDLATLGPQPRETVQLLRSLNCPCIMGNHDEFMLRPELVETYTSAPPVVAAIHWCREQLSPDELSFIETFQPKLERSLDDDHKVLLFHGTPTSHTRDVLSTTPAPDLDRILAGVQASVVAGGHTHVQMLRQHRGTWVVNPGSVGMPFREYVYGGPPTVLPHAEYAILEANRGGVRVDLRRVAVDRSVAVPAIQGCSNPMRDLLLLQYA